MQWIRPKLVKLSIICTALLTAGLVCRYAYIFIRYKADVACIKVQSVDLNQISDGRYYGDCNVDFVAAAVRIDISNGRILAVDLIEHHNDRGEAANILPLRIIEEQRIDVDVVTGATASSKVIQEAAYNALTGKRTIRR